MAATSKRLIVNADDFGLTPGVNEGIASAHEGGILTSASLMVRWPAAEQAAAYARLHPKLSVGLHVDLGEWVFRDEQWEVAYEVVPLDNASEIAEEISRQLKKFRELVGQEPTHLDSHQHVHETEPVRSLCLRAAEERHIVLRNTNSEIRYCGSFYGQSNKGYSYSEGISVEGLLKILKGLEPGVTELGCHPATRGDMAGMYREERPVECQTLCDPRAREAIQAEGIELCSFKNWRR